MDTTGENMTESVSDAGRPSKLKIRRDKEKIELSPATKIRVTPQETLPPLPKMRFTADIDRQAYLKLKFHSMITNESIISILNRLIYDRFTDKISI